MSIIIFIVILLILVIVHEFGHFIVAKKSGIRVDEFAFGFPPRLFSVKKGETTYSFNAVPFGGYVKIFGENPDEESTNGPDKARSFIHKPKRIQAAVLFAGVFFNILLAWLLLSIGFMSGQPTSVSDNPLVKNPALTVTGVRPDSPALQAGFEVGDKILSIQEKDMPLSELKDPSPETLRNFIVGHGNDTLLVTVLRAKENKILSVVPEVVSESSYPTIGVALDMVGTLKLPLHKALIEGAQLAASITWGTIKSFGMLIAGAFTGKASINDVTGPVGIVGVVGDAARFGFVYLLSFTALISINLAVINLVPFPALDGGRLLFLLIEKIKGSRISPKIANTANAIGFALLIILMLVITYHDIAKLL